MTDEDSGTVPAARDRIQNAAPDVARSLQEIAQNEDLSAADRAAAGKALRDLDLPTGDDDD